MTCCTGSGRAVEWGTLPSKAKLLQQLTSMTEVVIFEVLLDLQKAYYALDRDMCLGIIAVYGIGPKTIRLLRTYWGPLTMVARSSRYFGGHLRDTAA